MKEPKPEKLPVIFRIDRAKHDRMVTAVFPTLPFDVDGKQLAIYQHVGQHGGADWGWWWRRTHRLATPEEYADLLEELRGIYGRSTGPDDPAYELVPCRRMTAAHRRVFNAEVARLQKMRRESEAA